MTGAAILAQPASRNIPATHRYEDGVLRIITIGPTFPGLVAGAFDQIRGSAAGNPAILVQMLGGLQTVAGMTGDARRRQVLREHAAHLAETARRTIASPHDLERFEDRLGQVLAALVTAPSSTSKPQTRPSR